MLLAKGMVCSNPEKRVYKIKKAPAANAAGAFYVVEYDIVVGEEGYAFWELQSSSAAGFQQAA